MSTFARIYIFCIYALAVVGVIALLFIYLLHVEVIAIETICDTIESVLECKQYIVIKWKVIYNAKQTNALCANSAIWW